MFFNKIVKITKTPNDIAAGINQKFFHKCPSDIILFSAIKPAIQKPISIPTPYVANVIIPWADERNL